MIDPKKIYEFLMVSYEAEKYKSAAILALLQDFKENLDDDLAHDRDSSHRYTAIILGRLANEYKNISRHNGLSDDHFNKQKYCLEQALNIWQEKYPDQSWEQAQIYRNMASMYADQGQRSEQEHCLTQALNVLHEKQSPSHLLERAKTYRALASMYAAQSETDQQKLYLVEALKILTANQWDPTLMQQTGAPLELAKIYLDLTPTYGDIDSQQNCLNKALNVLLEKCPREHAELAKTYRALASTYGSQKRINDQKAHLDEALRILLNNCPEEHAELAKTYRALGSVYDSPGWIDEQRGYLNQALKILLDNCPGEHVELAKTYCDLAKIDRRLASICAAQGRVDNQQEYLDQALRILLNNCPEEYIACAEIYHDMAHMYGIQRRTKMQDYSSMPKRNIDERLQHLKVAKKHITEEAKCLEEALKISLKGRSDDTFNNKLRNDQKEVRAATAEIDAAIKNIPHERIELNERNSMIANVQTRMAELTKERLSWFSLHSDRKTLKINALKKLETLLVDTTKSAAEHVATIRRQYPMVDAGIISKRTKILLDNIVSEPREPNETHRLLPK